MKEFEDYTDEEKDKIVDDMANDLSELIKKYIPLVNLVGSLAICNQILMNTTKQAGYGKLLKESVNRQIPD